MKTALVLAAFLATAATAQAQSITHIARYSTETVALSDAACPNGPSGSRVVIHNAYVPERGSSYGCWTLVAGVVLLDWKVVANRRALPEEVPAKDFQPAN